VNKFLTYTLCISFGACGITKNDSKESGNSSGSNVSNSTSSSEKYTYDFNYNGCKTGKKEFTSKAAFCDGLKDHALNNGCAEILREEHFKRQSCSGSFVVTNKSTPSNPLKPSFQQLWVYGLKSFMLKDAKVKVEIRDLKNGQTLRNKQLICNSASPMHLMGNYPDISFELGILSCSGEEIPVSWHRLTGHLNRVLYRIKAVPGDSVTTQFHLSLDAIDLSKVPSNFIVQYPSEIYAQVQSNNALLDMNGSTLTRIAGKTMSLENSFKLWFEKQSDGKVQFKLNANIDQENGESVRYSIDERF
jgi:hypothetical protein